MAVALLQFGVQESVPSKIQKRITPISLDNLARLGPADSSILSADLLVDGDERYTLFHTAVDA
jgi:hypothetical protein